MPAVKKLFQESVCILLGILLHDGLHPASQWDGSSISASSHVVQMVEHGYRAVETFGDSLFLLDRYLLSAPALKRLAELNSSGMPHMDIVTKAKISCTAYELLPKRKPGRGRPAKKGAAAKLRELIATATGQFRETTETLYGRKETVRYYSTDLLWGQRLWR